MKNSRFNKSNIFSTAWSYLRANLFNSFSEALHAAWMKAKAIIALKSGQVTVTFRKANGTITQRLATLNSELFSYEAKTTDHNEKTDLVKFWSITDNGFRAFRIERLISIG